MVEMETRCVDCGLPCIGSGCPYHSVAVHYCDHCGEELDEMYEADGEELCEHCLKDKFRRG